MIWELKGGQDIKYPVYYGKDFGFHPKAEGRVFC